MSRRPRIIIVGAGFGGLWAARALAQAEADVYLLDKNNYHAFLPLLYQVAAAEIEPEQVAYPVRSILRQLRNVHFVMTEVTGFDLAQRVVYTTRQTYPYDYLVLATGSRAHFFGVPGAEEYAYPIKTIQQAVHLRHRILRSFEEAADEEDRDRRRQRLTFVIVGGGATGVEYAGALRELIDKPLARDFSSIQPHEVQVILLEAAPQLLPGWGRVSAAMPGVVWKRWGCRYASTPWSAALRLRTLYCATAATFRRTMSSGQPGYGATCRPTAARYPPGSTVALWWSLG